MPFPLTAPNRSLIHMGNRTVDVAEHESECGDIATITLDRPEKRNALALDVMLELTAALREVGDSDALGVILAANGPVFSAGHNFGDMARRRLAEARGGSSRCARR